MPETARLELSFGALAKPLAAQADLSAINADTVVHLQRDADAITRLLIRGLLSGAEAHRARKRLMRKIEQELKYAV